MLNNTTVQQIKVIWDDYRLQGNKVFDKNGKEFDNIDQNRLVAIEDIRKIINTFLEGKLELPDFKTNLDSYNKQHNYWGFTAAKGQMFLT